MIIIYRSMENRIHKGQVLIFSIIIRAWESCTKIPFSIVYIKSWRAVQLNYKSKTRCSAHRMGNKESFRGRLNYRAIQFGEPQRWRFRSTEFTFDHNHMPFQIMSPSIDQNVTRYDWAVTTRNISLHLIYYSSKLGAWLKCETRWTYSRGDLFTQASMY